MRRVILILLACCGISASKPEKTYSLLIDENHFLPYYDTAAPNKFSGFARKLLDRFADSQGFRFDYMVMPAKRLQYLQTRNRFDFRFPDSPHWAAEDKAGVAIHYSEPIVGYRDGIFAQAYKPLPANDITVYHFAILRGFTPLSFQELLKAGKVRFLEVSDYRAAFKMLREGRVHGIYGNENVLNYQYSELDATPLTLLANFAYSQDFQRLSTVSHGHLIEAFNSWLKKDDAWLDRLFAEYRLTKPQK